jgi:hypothetical protein
MKGISSLSLSLSGEGIRSGWGGEMYLSRDLEYERDITLIALTLRHVPRMMAFIVFFATSAYYLYWQTAAIWAAIAWGVLSLIFRPGVCLDLSQRPIGQILAGSLLGYRWIFVVICAAVIWYRTQPLIWYGIWVLLFVFVLEGAAAVFIDAREEVECRSRYRELIASQDA